MNYQYNKQPLSIDRLDYEIRTSPIVTALDYITGEAGLTNIIFKASLSVEDKAKLDAIVSAHSGLPLIPPVEQIVNLASKEKTPSGYLKVATYEAEGDAASIVSHNFGDPTTWFQFSKEMIKETLTNSSGNIFIGTKPNWIDLFHGRLYDEDNVVLQNPGKYGVKIYVDDVLYPANSYVINYAMGSVTFNSPIVGTIVTASYRYADKSYYAIKPKAGKTLAIKRAEVQFSANTNINSPFVFEAWFNHPLYGMVPVPGSTTVYKNAKDFISACNEGQGLIPKWGELTQDVHVFPFDYARPKPLKASQGVEIRVYCKDHLPVNSEFATATFYVTVDNEVIS